MLNSQFSLVTNAEKVFGVAGESLASFDLCYLKADGRYWKADATTEETMPGIVLALGAMAAGDGALFHRRGPITNAAWTWGTIGVPVYASETEADISESLPETSGAVAQIVGQVLSATSLYFDPEMFTVVLD